jgi:hypothetical protein
VTGMTRATLPRLRVDRTTYGTYEVAPRRVTSLIKYRPGSQPAVSVLTEGLQGATTVRVAAGRKTGRRCIEP